MIVKTLSPCITTSQVAETRDFYVRHFGATVTFDCGWYVNLCFGNDATTLQCMAPQEGQALCNPAGLTYNFQVADVDAEYRTLTGTGLTPIMPIEDHPWGDRGFAVQDPNGVVLYLYSEREAALEFKPFFKA